MTFIMASVRKYAGLPDLVRTKTPRAYLHYLPNLKDAAPDIYETPELTDDNSTHPVGFN